MKEAYIGIPSLTEAQRACETLHRYQIGCGVMRMPVLPGLSGCAFGLRIREENIPAALRRLREQGRRTGKVLVRGADGKLTEREEA